MKIANTLKLLLKSVLSLQFGEVSTDKSTLYWDSTDNLKEGDEVYVKGENEDFVPAPDGEYTTEDGKVITVVEGKVASIKDPEAEVAPEEAPAEENIEAKAEVDETEVKAEAEEEIPAPADEEETPAEEEATEEDRLASLEEKVNAIVEGLNEIINSIASLEGRIAEVEGKLAKVEAPAADPVEEEIPVEEEKKTRLSYMRKK